MIIVTLFIHLSYYYPGIDENERLYSKIRELEDKGGLSSSRERGRSFDSLSDLTNIELDLDFNALDKER